MRRVGLVFALLSACAAPEPEISLVRPSFARMIDLPQLSGQLRVEDASGETVADERLVIDGDVASANVPGLPADQDLTLTIEWIAAGVTVASTDPLPVRVGADEAVDLVLTEDQYRFPDADGDGADDIFEVQFDSPDGSNYAESPSLAPPGFFNAFVEGHGTSGLTVRNTSRSEGAFGDYALALLTLNTVPPTYSLESVELGSRNRVVRELCSLADLGPAIALTSLRGVAVCGDQIETFDPITLDIATTITAPLPIYQILVSRNGNAIYALTASDPQEVLVMNTSTLGLLAQIPLTGGVNYNDIADLGTRLVVLEVGVGQLEVFSHTNNFGFTALEPALVGETVGAENIIAHPNGEWLYIDSAQGAINVVDVAADSPADWVITDQVDVGFSEAIARRFAIEPRFGYWMYAVAAGDFVRINLLTNEVEWRVTFGDDELAIMTDVSVAADSGFGMVSNVLAGMLTMGFASESTREVEPNNGLADLSGSGNVLGPPYAAVTGFADQADAGELTHSGVTVASEDIEDLWEIVPGTAPTGGRLAIALIPAFPLSNANLLLLDGSGTVLARAFGTNDAGTQHDGGPLLITDDVASLPTDLYAGVDFVDTLLSPLGNGGLYELLLVEVPASIPESSAPAPGTSLPDAPAVVTGSYGGGNLDCFTISSTSTSKRLGLVLEPVGPLVPRLSFFSGGTKIFEGNHLEPGGTDSFVATEWFLDENPLICPYLRDATGAAASGSYRLTIVDLEP